MEGTLRRDDTWFYDRSEGPLLQDDRNTDTKDGVKHRFRKQFLPLLGSYSKC